MADAQKWLHFLNPSSPAGERVITNSGRVDNDLRDYVPLSVAIDPFCATHPTTGGQTSKFFPRLPAGVTTADGRPRMPRLSLTQSSASAQSMTHAVAQQIFMAHDDTVFEKSASPELPPESRWELSGGTPVRRQFEGNFSWLVTLTPAYFDIEVPAPVTKYNVSIAIFFKRNLAARATESGVEHERMVDVSPSRSDLAGFGLGGGELVLRGDQNATAQANQANTALKPGQWVLVCGRYRLEGSPPSFASVFRWYRVVTVGEYDNANNRNQRPITLAGPDWAGATDPNPNDWRCKPSHVAIFEGCVGVFEKTVHLEGPSVWSN
jgi:hypothetical protein